MEKLPAGNYPAEYELKGCQVSGPPPDFKYYHKIIMAADLRRFTETMMDMRNPKNMGSFLSKLFDGMAEIVKKQNGSVNKYLGDGFLVHFPVDDPAKLPEILPNIVEGLFEIKNYIFEQNKDLFDLQKLGLSIVLLDDSRVTMGKIGNIVYTDYSLIGREVNSLFRALDAAKGNMILVYKNLVEFLHEKWVLVDIGVQTYDGIYEPIRLYSILRPREPEENGKIIRGCISKCASYNLCIKAYNEGKNGKKMINCGNYNKDKEESKNCWHWFHCKVKNHYGEAHQNFENFSCCHICVHFASCFHSFFLGKFNHPMIWCGKPNPYQTISATL
jgi:class 3 adenylate cyclase